MAKARDLGRRSAWEAGPCLREECSSDLGTGGAEREHLVEDEAESVRSRSLGQRSSMATNGSPLGGFGGIGGVERRGGPQNGLQCLQERPIEA